MHRLPLVSHLAIGLFLAACGSDTNKSTTVGENADAQTSSTSDTKSSDTPQPTNALDALSELSGGDDTASSTPEIVETWCDAALGGASGERALALAFAHHCRRHVCSD